MATGNEYQCSFYSMRHVRKSILLATGDQIKLTDIKICTGFTLVLPSRRFVLDFSYINFSLKRYIYEFSSQACMHCANLVTT